MNRESNQPHKVGSADDGEGLQAETTLGHTSPTPTPSIASPVWAFLRRPRHAIAVAATLVVAIVGSQTVLAHVNAAVGDPASLESASVIGENSTGAVFRETFNGHPAQPTSVLNRSDLLPGWFAQPAMQGTWGWDTAPEPMAADHGSDCGPVPGTHQISSYADSVYSCKDHLMTALNPPSHGTASGIMVLKPNHLLDLSKGSGQVRIDVSTESRSPFGDWWEMWLSPWEDQVVSPTGHWLHHAGPPKKGVMIQIRNKQVSYKVFDNYQEVSGVEFWEGVTVDDVVTPSMTRRDPYVLKIEGNKARFMIGNSATGGALVEMINFDLPAGLLSNKAVVQFQQSNYEPELNQKVGCAGDPCPVTHTANSWHWDNAEIVPALPYTLINTAQFQVTGTTSNRMDFDAPAPPGAFLLFNGYTKGNGLHPQTGQMQVSFDGSKWANAPLVRRKQRQRTGDRPALLQDRRARGGYPGLLQG